MYDIPSRYNPKDVEDKHYKFWEENNLFHAEEDPAKNPFSIVIPPPNITGILHMGHALNNTIQDILIRWRRMAGDSCLWMPGTDHAGIATQNVVEKALAKEGRKRQDLGRDGFLEEIWKWRDKYGSTIIRQLKKLGASCDWERTRFTMDKEYSEAVKAAFVSLWKKGLIYQDEKIINWCPRCQTALSDEEAAHHEIQGYLYYLKYPFKDEPERFVTVATTRPETMLGDTAVAVNPKDKRYKKDIGKTLILPLLNRKIKIIADSIVDMKFGTGAVKVTPAHDPNDYEIGKRHKLQFINIMHPNGVLNNQAGEYENMDRFEARKVVVEDLKERGLLAGEPQPHKHVVGHCYRCHTVIEPYLSWQWFVKMKSLAKPAIEAVKKGEIKFYPKRWTKVYLNWMENIHDWCISRQIWWGHRIPIWYCSDCKKLAIASMEKPQSCSACKSSNLRQDENVLDTWFSSWLWPFATFGWPFQSQAKSDKQRAELKQFYPTSVLVTAPEIIFFWVARMVMAGFEFMGSKPFSDVYIHGTVRDAGGKKMSKSLGNVIDPIDIINEFGCDALRFSIIYLASGGQDIFLSKEKFELGRNFANKVWNAFRFTLICLKPPPTSKGKSEAGIFNPSLADKWILSRLNQTIDKVTRSLEKYRLNDAANAIYEFFWHEFCDWYLELIKPSLTASNEAELASLSQESIAASPNPETTRAVLFHTLETSLRLLHPFMPFITAEIWQHLKRISDPSDSEGLKGLADHSSFLARLRGNNKDEILNKESIMVSDWPVLDKKQIDKIAQEKVSFIIAVISAIRNVRSEMNIPQSKRVELILSAPSTDGADMLKESIRDIAYFARANTVRIEKKIKQPPKFSAAALVNGVEIFVLLEGMIDLKAEKARLTKKTAAIEKEISQINRRLKNKDFLNKAPQDIVFKERLRQGSLKTSLNKLRDISKRIT